MTAKRTEPRMHAYARPIDGDYVNSSKTTTEHLRAVFDAERARIAQQNAPRRRRRKPVPPAGDNAAQLQLVA
ncbi:hypothetical protein [uncultured Xylophilus sp.]|uniref:hypothetical protein n=1 Tax=uncultured Xylophilus sp. TaxID=296832 RepID=UPI0025DDA4B1|nr:hypothetical protein [uncultured Xylophilus sp.]